MQSSLKAMYYVALDCEADAHNTDEEKYQWKMANQNRLNQNFSAIASVIDLLEQRIIELENK